MPNDRTYGTDPQDRFEEDEEQPGLLEEGGRLDPQTFPDWIPTADKSKRFRETKSVPEHLFDTIILMLFMGIVSMTAVVGVGLIALFVWVFITQYPLLSLGVVAVVVVAPVLGVVSYNVVNKIGAILYRYNQQ